MKSLILFVSGAICGAAICALVLSTHHAAAPQEPPAVTASANPSAEPSPEKAVAPTAESAPPVPRHVAEPVPAVTASVPTNEPANPIRKAVDDLLGAKSGKEKQEAFAELRKNGQLDAAIAELRQRLTDNPNDAEISTTLGEALLNKVRQLRESGNMDNNEAGILAMQADQQFNASLKIDPQNWEANFVKAAAMSRWPANPERDADVVQRLTSLIDQQDNAPSRPEFAQSYVVLGDQYQKMGQPDKAVVTWQLGLQKFPGNADLQRRAGSK